MSVPERWEPLARDAVLALCDEDDCRLPSWSLPTAAPRAEDASGGGGRLRFRDAAKALEGNESLAPPQRRREGRGKAGSQKAQEGDAEEPCAE